MISAINSVNSFKGFYTVDEDKMSSTQKQTVLNLESLLKEEAQTKDFLVRKGTEADSVTLSQVFGLKCSKNKMQAGEYIYTNAIKIGTYNTDSFELSDIQKAYNKREQQKKDNIFVAIGLLLLAGYLSLATVHYVKRVLPVAKGMNKNNIEMVNDSLKNNLVKRLK